MSKKMKVRIIQVTIILMAIFAINSVLATIKADTYKKEGKESLKKNFPYLAVDKFSKALKLDSSDGETRGYLGISYISLAEKTNKEELLKKAIYEMEDAGKTYEDSSINYHLANAYELSGDVDNAIQEAIKSYNQIPSGQTKDKLIALYKIKGDILLSQNKRDEAIKYYTKFVELKGIDVKKEDTAGYEFLRNLMPDNFLIHYCLAQFYMNQNLWEKAVVELEYIKGIGVLNEDIMERLVFIYYNLGNKYYNEKKLKEAERYLSYIINTDSISRFGYTVAAINNVSSMYEQVGNIDKAVETLMKLEEIDTQKGEGYRQIGHLFSRKSNFQKAIEYFEKYIPFRPISDTGIFFILGNLYDQVGDIDKAVKIYSKLENINSHKGQGHYYIGLLYKKKEKWIDALREFEYVSEIKPEDSQLLFKIGGLYEKIGNNKKALEIYKRIILIDPTMIKELNISMARVYKKMGEKERAAYQLKKWRMVERTF